MPFPIAYLAGSFPLRSETFVWREVRELRCRGWDVHTFALHPPQESADELADLRAETRYIYTAGRFMLTAQREAAFPGRTLATIGRVLTDALRPGEPTGLKGRIKPFVQLQAALALAAMCRVAGVRHIHAHFAHAPATVAMYAAGQMGIGFSFTGHANDLFQRRHLLRRKLQRASFVACISQWHRELYSSIEPRGHYELIRCGVPLATPAEEAAEPAPPREKESARLRVLTVARLVEKKGIDTLIGAVARVPGVRLTIAGDGPQRARLQELAARDAPEQCRFVGAVSSDEVGRLLGEHDAFALPCRPDSAGDRDGIPVALMEAMGGRLPVIAGDLPAIRELVRDGDTGRLVPAEWSEQAISATAGVLAEWRDDPAERRRLGEAGREWVRQEFSLDANVERLERALEASGAPHR